ncbi:MAG: hypothetical protein ACK4GQ_05575, partial [Candidatus Hadarchaeales archaeon]
MNIFLLGRPGCGKSAVFHILERELRKRGYGGEIKRIDDFPILKKIFESDVEFKRHRPCPEGGVKVTDDTVWDDLIKGLDRQAKEFLGRDIILFIEFSRDSYRRAFKNFSPEVLKDSVVVYIDAPFDICWERNVRRARLESGLDAHLVSREEMEKTYLHDDHEELQRELDLPVVIVKNDLDGTELLEKELEKVAGNIDTANRELNDLKTKIASAVDGDPLWPWPEMLNSLY